MKFLYIFIDTLRPSLLNIMNPNVEETDLDRLFMALGGTVYTKCFTPGPDTPRGLASFWTGQLPMKNGCDKRIRYPKYYLNENSKTIWDTFKDLGYKINIFAREQMIDIGIFPKTIEPPIYNDITEFATSVSIDDDSITFVVLTDYCDGLGEYNYSMNGVKKGHKKVSDVMHIFFDKFNKDDFDYIFIFSDHGHKTLKERTDSPKYLLSKDRTNIFTLIHKKNDNNIIYNNKLCSIIDFYPTLLEILGKPISTDIDGISFFSEKEHEFIIAEDHNYFSPEANQLIDRWAVIRKNSIYYRDLSGWTNSPEIMKENDKIIAGHSEHFKIAEKENEILKKYVNIYQYHTYSDGEKILIHNDLFTYTMKIIDHNKWLKKIVKKILK